MKYLQILFIGVFVVFQTACSDWLDVKPISEIDEVDLFSTEEGFMDALHGVYLKLGEKDVYGDNLTMSFLDVLGQNYYIPSGSRYIDIVFYNYETTLAESKINAIWSNLYNAIANCNNIIEHLDKVDKSMFIGTNYERVKGETYALRAMLHFDLLRMFNAPYASNPEFLGIPYVETLKIEASEQLTTTECINKVLRDLELARGLLSTVDTEESEGSYRENYCNYYAVLALEARVNLYKNDYPTAFSKAMEVIEAEVFEWIDPQEIVQQNDYIFYREHIFSIYSSKIGEFSREHFQDKADDELQCSLRSQEIYDGDGNDIRYKYWFHTIPAYEGNEEKRMLDKYNRPTESEEEQAYADPVVPIVKFSEMYLIAAEVLANNNLEEAIVMLNVLKDNRNALLLDGDVTKVDFMEELKLEYEKEMYGEGQLFYFFKRMNYPTIQGSAGTLIEMNDTKYTLPFPKDEVQFGGRTN